MPNVEEIDNFLALSDSIATAGQPNELQFAALKTSGYQVVVNLALPTSTNAIAHEQDLVEAQGMKYVHIPVVWENPTIDDFDRFMQTMNENANQKVLVHCAMNMRVSAFMYLYRRIHDCISADEANQALQKIWTPNPIWQQFMEQVLERYQQ
jgi:protein tyrosine phosphatase (PTP) superfamily phosphohydrolase (DUF442 family)